MSRQCYPHKPFEVTIKLNGHDWLEVMQGLQEVADHLPDHGPACELVTANIIVTVADDPDMTRERYESAVRRWREERTRTGSSE